MPLSKVERRWLQEARRSLRLAHTYAENGSDWDAVVASAESVYRTPMAAHDAVIEVKNLLASLATTAPSQLRTNRAMRTAATKRIKEAILFIGETLVGDN